MLSSRPSHFFLKELIMSSDLGLGTRLYNDVCKAFDEKKEFDAGKLGLSERKYLYEEIFVSKERYPRIAAMLQSNLEASSKELIGSAGFQACAAGEEPVTRIVVWYVAHILTNGPAKDCEEHKDVFRQCVLV
jgi:hypothetical protein